MKKRILTLACVTAISLTTACIACSCGTNSSHAKNDAYYTERNISSPQDRARDVLPPMTDDSSSDDSFEGNPDFPTPAPVPQPAPKPFLPRLPHHRRPAPPPPAKGAPDCSDGSCDESGGESGDNPISSAPAQSESSSSDEHTKGRKRDGKHLYPPKENPVAKAD